MKLHIKKVMVSLLYLIAAQHFLLSELHASPVSPVISSTQVKKNIDKKSVAQALRPFNVYLNKLRNFTASITQTNPKGTILNGTLYVSKPGKMRLVYHNSPIDLISDGKHILHYNKKKKEGNRISMKNTPLAFLLEDGKLEDCATIKQLHWERKNLVITVCDNRDPESGEVRLFFQKNPVVLLGWRITNDKQESTTVKLEKIKEKKYNDNIFNII